MAVSRRRTCGCVALGTVLVAGMWIAAGMPAWAAATGGALSERIYRIHQVVTGEGPADGVGLKDQIDAVTQLLYGAGWESKVSPSLIGRVDQLQRLVELGDPNVSIFSKELAIEWTINQALYEWELAREKKGVEGLAVTAQGPSLRPLLERVVWLETLLYGKAMPGGLVERIDRLGREVWGGSTAVQIRTKVVKVQRNSGNVRIMLLGTISNERGSESKPGQQVPFVVMDDLKLEDALVIPRGSLGVATVEVVETPILGRAGKLSASGLVWAINGIGLGATLGFDEATAKAGLSMAVALSGPAVAPTGLLVQGGSKRLDPGSVLVAAIGPGPGWKEVPVIDAPIL